VPRFCPHAKYLKPSQRHAVSHRWQGKPVGCLPVNTNSYLLFYARMFYFAQHRVRTARAGTGFCRSRTGIHVA
jgi:hypothetical protein